MSHHARLVGRDPVREGLPVAGVVAAAEAEEVVVERLHVRVPARDGHAPVAQLGEVLDEGLGVVGDVVGLEEPEVLLVLADVVEDVRVGVAPEHLLEVRREHVEVLDRLVGAPVEQHVPGVRPGAVQDHARLVGVPRLHRAVGRLEHLALPRVGDAHHRRAEGGVPVALHERRLPDRAHLDAVGVRRQPRAQVGLGGRRRGARAEKRPGEAGERGARAAGIVQGHGRRVLCGTSARGGGTDASASSAGPSRASHAA